MTTQTVAQMNLLATESPVAGVVDEIINLDPLMEFVPFETLNGTQKRWIRESTLPTPQFYDVDEELVEGNPTFAEVTVSLKQIAVDSTLPGLHVTKENVNAQRALNVNKIAKSLLEEVGGKMIYGNATSYSKEFNGLQALSPAAQTTNEGSSSTGSALNLSNLDLTIDLVRNPSSPSVIMVNRQIKRRLNQSVSTSQISTVPIRQTTDEFGRVVQFYQDLPLRRSDRMGQVEAISGGTFSAETGGATSSIFVLTFGSPDSVSPGIFGIQGAGGIQYEDKGSDENKDNLRDRLKWYLAMGLGSTKSIGRIDGITDAAVVA
jgi:hypothetical protein